MKIKLTLLLGYLLGISFLLNACGSSNSPTSTQATPTPILTPTSTTYPTITPIPTPQNISIVVYNSSVGGQVMMSMDSGTPSNTYPITFLTTVSGQHDFLTTSPNGNVSFNGNNVGNSYSCLSSSLTPGSTNSIFINCAPTCSIVWTATFWLDSLAKS